MDNPAPAGPMRAYFAIKYHEDQTNRLKIERIIEVLTCAGYGTICVARDIEAWGEASYEPQALMARSFEEIDRCDLVVVELTEKGVGIGIEAGYAYAQGKPIVTIAERGADISTTLAGISSRVILYDRVEDLSRLFERLRETIAQ